MARKVSLRGLSAEFQLGNNGVTISVKDDKDPERNGRLRIGRGTISWTRVVGRGRPQKPTKKTWEKLIDFLKSEED